MKLPGNRVSSIQISLFFNHVYDNLSFIVIKPFVQSYQKKTRVTLGGRLYRPVAQEIWIPLDPPPPTPPGKMYSVVLTSNVLKKLLELFAV